MAKVRWAWVDNIPPMIEYQGEKGGVPVYDDRKLFEYLVLDGIQAGLNWELVLNKREN